MPGIPLSIKRRAKWTEKRVRPTLSRPTGRLRTLPTVLVIGAQRAGTSSMFYALSRHPCSARPLTKEIHFFDYQFHRGIDWYRSYFPLTAWRDLRRITGRDAFGIDATPYYLFHPAVPSRVAATIPDAKLVVLLRDPVARARSHYEWVRQANLEPLSFPDALAAEEDRLAGEEEQLLAKPRYRSHHHRRHSYVARGLYADQIERWLAHFPRSSLVVVVSEEFFARPREVYAETIAALGLPQWQPADFPRRNVGPERETNEEMQAWLAARFAEPNERLRRLLGRELPWERTRAARAFRASPR